MKKLLSVLLAVSFLLCQWAEGAAEEGSPEVEAPAAVLMENATGTILYEKGAEEERSPASVTRAEARPPTINRRQPTFKRELGCSCIKTNSFLFLLCIN